MAARRFQGAGPSPWWGTAAALVQPMRTSPSASRWSRMSKLAHDRNIVVLFAGGNDGPAPDTYNPYAKAPWVIGVAAGTKEGGLASFSSRGTPREQRLADSDPLNDNDAPTITAPGTGREFDSDSAKFTTDII